MFHQIDISKYDLSSCKLCQETFSEIINSYHCYTDILDASTNKLQRKIAITFDDGYEDVYRIAFPFLKKNNIPFTVFVVEDFLDTPGYLSKTQLRCLSDASNVTIGSHGKSHQVLTKMDFLDKKREIQGSKMNIENIIGKEVPVFSYSHGQFDNECLDLVKVYKAAYAANSLPINILTQRKIYSLPRINIDEHTVSNLNSIIKY